MKQKIAVVGVGKLGLCFALNIERAGYDVWGVETNLEYAAQLSANTFQSDEPEVNSLLSSSQNFHVVTDIDCIVEHDIRDIFIMVATPSLPDGGYDHSQVNRVVERLSAIGDPANIRHLYIGCTTMPGYCNELAEQLKPFGYTVSYNPEFIAQGSIIHNQVYPDQVLIGEASEEVGARLEAIYRSFVKSDAVYCRMDPLSAEITKLATNCFLTTKISFANSIGDLAKTAGANPDKILSAIGSDSRIGGKYFGYGYGFGGPCFPRDNRALGKFASDLGRPLRISAATDKVNEEHFQFQLDEYLEKTIPGDSIVFEGVAYKVGTSQITESQQLRLAVALAEQKRSVTIKDSVAVINQVQSIYPGLFSFETDLSSVS